MLLCFFLEHKYAEMEDVHVERDYYCNTKELIQKDLYFSLNDSEEIQRCVFASWDSYDNGYQWVYIFPVDLLYSDDWRQPLIELAEKDKEKDRAKRERLQKAREEKELALLEKLKSKYEG